MKPQRENKRFFNNKIKAQIHDLLLLVMVKASVNSEPDAKMT